MKTVNFDVELKDIKGSPMIDAETGKPLTMTRAIVNACGMAFFDPTNGQRTMQESGEMMLTRYKLGTRLLAGGNQDISDEESVLIKKLVGQVAHWTPAILGQVTALLDRKEPEKK